MASDPGTTRDKQESVTICLQNWEAHDPEKITITVYDATAVNPSSHSFKVQF